MTYIFNTGGFLPEKMHCMMMQGKLQGQTLEDALALGKEMVSGRLKVLLVRLPLLSANSDTLLRSAKLASVG